MRPFSGELVSIVAVGAIVAALVLEFPSAAISFRARSGAHTSAERGAFAAYVFMDEQTEARFLRKAKETWRKGGREYADLSVVELPEGEKKPVMTLDSRTLPPQPPIAEGGLSPFLPSSRAPEPIRIPAAADKARLPFPREELLKID